MITKRCRNQCFASQECILKRQSTHFPSCKNLDSPFLHPAVHSTKLKGTDRQNGLQARRRSLWHASGEHRQQAHLQAASKHAFQAVCL